MLQKKEDLLPSTAEEYLEQGSADEESGDRWLGSDLAKSLRFYQKAYTSYLHSIKLDPLNLDTIYNSARLLFHVYFQYNKTEGVDVYELNNVDEVVNVENSVLQPLVNIVLAHEQALALCAQASITPPNDLYFNTAMVYTELIETIDEPIQILLDIGLKAQQLYSSLLENQVELFERFLVDLQGIDEVEGYSEYSEPMHSQEAHQEEYTAVETVQPLDIYESLLNSYRLIQALIDNADPGEIPFVTDKFNLFVTAFNEVADNLIDKYSEQSLLKISMIENLAHDQVNDLILARNLLKASVTTNLDDILELWNPIQNNLKKFMMINDNLQLYLDKQPTTPDISWKCLSQMTNYLKLAQQDLQAQLAELQKTSNQSGASPLIIQICSILISRADIDVQRFQLDCQQARNNQNLLLSNATNFVKNAINFSNVSGGLREVASDKLQRLKKLADAKLRLCLLQQKTSIDELDQIVGRNRWVRELNELMKLEYYDKFGVQFIVREYQETHH